MDHYRISHRANGTAMTRGYSAPGSYADTSRRPYGGSGPAQTSYRPGIDTGHYAASAYEVTPERRAGMSSRYGAGAGYGTSASAARSYGGATAGYGTTAGGYGTTARDYATAGRSHGTTARDYTAAGRSYGTATSSGYGTSSSFNRNPYVTARAEPTTQRLSNWCDGYAGPSGSGRAPYDYGPLGPARGPLNPREAYGGGSGRNWYQGGSYDEGGRSRTQGYGGGGGGYGRAGSGYGGGYY